MEASAVSILMRAVELDQCKRYTESIVCYQEGIQLLLNVLKDTNDEAKKGHFRKKIEGYMNRAEKIKDIIEREKDAGRYHEQFRIENNSKGHSYGKVFGRFLDESAREVFVEDPYVRSHHQLVNFLRFCELCAGRAPNMRCIHLVTGQQPPPDPQAARLAEIGRSLQGGYGIRLEVAYSDTLHDREVRVDNGAGSGWVVKVGRGLDYFKPPESKFSLGAHDLDLRPCHETTVDVFHTKHLKRL